MYRLLLASDSSETLELYKDTAWERLGFYAPHIVSTPQTVLDSLKNRHADAMILKMNSESTDVLMAHLIKDYPTLPILDADTSMQDIAQSLTELKSLLNKINVDFSNDDYTAETMMSLYRHDFFRNLLSGKICDEKKLRRYLNLFRSRMNPDVPCVLVQLTMPDIDEFLNERWHYGNERLEVALRNIFGAETDGMRVLESVTKEGKIYVLYCPMTGVAQTSDLSITQEVDIHVKDCVQHVNDYMMIPIEVAGVRVLPSLTILTDTNRAEL